MSVLFFIRHGQASFGGADYDKLSDTGKVQAIKLAEYLHDAKICFNEIYSGTLVRHRETVNEYIAVSNLRNIPIKKIQYDDRLNEYDAKGILTLLIPILLSEKPHLKEHTDRFLSDKKSFQIIFLFIYPPAGSGMDSSSASHTDTSVDMYSSRETRQTTRDIPAFMISRRHIAQGCVSSRSLPVFTSIPVR